MIASLSKLIYESRGQLGIKLNPGALKIEFKSEKRYKELIEENFQKPVPAREMRFFEEEKIENEDNAADG